jgi:hypothetical protein
MAVAQRFSLFHDPVIPFEQWNNHLQCPHPRNKPMRGQPGYRGRGAEYLPVRCGTALRPSHSLYVKKCITVLGRSIHKTRIEMRAEVDLYPMVVGMREAIFKSVRAKLRFPLALSVTSFPCLPGVLDKMFELASLEPLTVIDQKPFRIIKVWVNFSISFGLFVLTHDHPNSS